MELHGAHTLDRRPITEPKKRRKIRSATLIGYSEAAAAVGLDPVAMLRRVGLDPRCMADTDTIISLDAFLALLAESAAASGRHDFGMRAAIARGTPDLGAVSLLMREAESVEAALGYYTSHIGLHSDGLVVHLDKRFRRPLLIVEMDAPTSEQSFQATQFALTSITMLVRWLIGRDFQPEMVSYAFPKPACMRQDMQNFFQCPIGYAQVVSGMMLRPDLLVQPPVTSQPFLRKLAQRQLEPILARAPQSFATTVDRLIRRMLEVGAFDAQSVAHQLGIDRRTLNRRLAREGETFSSVLQRIRVEVTCRALHASDCSLTEVADAAGFDSLSSFSRWFHQSLGCTATAWRKQPIA